MYKTGIKYDEATNAEPGPGTRIYILLPSFFVMSVDQLTPWRPPP